MFDTQSAPSPVVGEIISHYGLVEKIGSGGMGVVYKCWDTRLERHVALKAILPEIVTDPKHRQRFIQEAKAASALNHPHIVTVYDINNAEDVDFIVMEFVEGQTLERLICAGPLPVLQALDYLIQIADAMSKAHSEGIIHRDLKPSNIMITPEGNVKILDFGLAKLVETGDSQEYDQNKNASQLLTREGKVIGTLAYMAPEQAEGRPTDARSDIFSLGVIFFELLTGQRLFAGNINIALVTALTHENCVPFHQMMPGILPNDCEDVVMRCLRVNAQHRWQSMQEVKAALELIKAKRLADQSVGLAIVNFLSRYRNLIILSTLVASSLAVAAYFLMPDMTSPRERRPFREDQFTFSGRAHSPALAPNGLYVAYVSDKPNEKQTLIIRDSKGGETPLAKGDYIDGLRWSFDGSEILFHRKTSVAFQEQNVESQSRIDVLSHYGELVNQFAGSLACWYKQDGSEIASTFSNYKEILIFNKHSGEIKSKFSLSDYSYINDLDYNWRVEKFVAPVEKDGRFQLRIFNADGSNERVLAEENQDIYSARLSPKGDWVYFIHGNEYISHLSKISTSRKNSKSILIRSGLQNNVNCRQCFNISEDGQKLSYTRGNPSTNLYKVVLGQKNQDKSFVSRLTFGTYIYATPAISPDGNWIAFTRRDNTGGNLFKMPYAGGESIRLTFFENASAMSASWSGDGKELAFILEKNGKRSISKVSAAGGAHQTLELLKEGNIGHALAWWPSPSIVYAKTGQHNYMQFWPESPATVPLLQHGEGWVAFKPIFSPDGKQAAIRWNRKNHGLWLINLNPYSETLLAPGFVHPVGWSQDKKFVFAIRSENGSAGPEVIKVRVDSPHKVISLAILPGQVNFHQDACIHANGKEMVVSITEGEASDVWIISNFDDVG